MAEFAVIAPVLFMILVGVLEMGRMMATWIAIQQGTQEAARSGAIAVAGQTQAQTHARILTAARDYTGLVGAGLAECANAEITNSVCRTPEGGTVVIACADNGTDGAPDGGCDPATTQVSGGWVRVRMTYPFQPVPLVYPFGTIQLYGWAQERVE